MEPASSKTTKGEDPFYSHPVKLDGSGFNFMEIVDGKGAVFTVEDVYEEVEEKFSKLWKADELDTIGIQPEVHVGGAFKQLEKDFVPITDDKMVLKKVTKHGMGPLIPKNAYVTLHYKYYVENNDEPVDSSWLRNQPVRFSQGSGTILPAIDFAVITMKKGEEALFIAHFNYCYGPMGVPPRIPPKARLLIQIQILNYINDDAVISYNAMAPDDKRDVPLEQVLVIAGELRRKGNELFKGKPKLAYNKFLEAINLLKDRSVKDDQEESLKNDELTKSLINIVHASLNLARTNDAKKYADEAISILKKNQDVNRTSLAKCLLLKSNAFHKESKLDEAQKCLNEAIKYEPGDELLREALANLAKSQEKANIVRDATYKNMGVKMGFRSAD